MTDSLHHDRPIYQIAALRAPRSDPPNGGLWLGMALLAARHRQTEATPGISELLCDMLIQVDDSFPYLDRVCVARLIGGNQLRVVDAWTAANLRNGTMSVGYGCFVDPAGSLTQLQDGQLRIYSNTAQVLDRYASQCHPPQRSIRLIHEMGLRSGLCAGLNLHGRRLGFLFINAKQPNAFDHLSERQFGCLTIAINAARAELAPWFGDLADGSVGMPLDGQALAAAVAAALGQQRVPVAECVVELHGPRVIGSIERLTAVLALGCAACWNGHPDAPLSLRIDGRIGDDRAQLSLSSPQFAPFTPAAGWHAQAAARLARSWGMQFELSGEGATLSFVTDVAHPDVPYSV